MDIGGRNLRVIDATELKNSLGKHLGLSAAEDMFVKKNGEIVTDNAKDFIGHKTPAYHPTEIVALLSKGQ